MKTILITGDIVFFRALDIMEKIKKVFDASEIFCINNPNEYYEKLKSSMEKFLVSTVEGKLKNNFDCNLMIYFPKKINDYQNDADLIYKTIIECEKAFEIANRIGLEKKKMGELLDILKIKIHNCQLGCF